MADIICSNCGVSNAARHTHCSFCGQPLNTEPDNPSILPGDAPTKKTTAELEPILPQWLRDARQQARDMAQKNATEDARIAAENPAPAQQINPADLLAGLAATARQDESDEVPDWMRGVPGTTSTSRAEKTEDPSFSRRQEIRWEQEPIEDAPASPSAEHNEEVPSWMRAADPPSPEKEEITDWLNQKNESAAPAHFEAEPGESSNWMDPVESAPFEAGPPPMSTANESAADLPDWMKLDSATPTPEAAAPGRLPDWLAAMKPTETSLPTAHIEPAETKTSPLITSDESKGGINVDELLSIEMPDWLSNISPTDRPITKPDIESQPPQEIAPASLPSWVQAMRPVENIMPGITPSASRQARESEGPLAGLAGVLPAAPGFATSGKPKAISIRLQASDAQQTGATLLEQMLAAEANPRPMRSTSLAASQQSLRWGIAILLFLLVAATLLLRTQIVPFPALSAESALSQQILETLPQDAPVLVIFDYEPALAGEMEASAASFMHTLIGSRQPRLTLLSTSPTGFALSEHFFSETQSQTLVRGEHFTNLGYLPGGATGILAFAQNPPNAMRFNLAWHTALTQNINALADYALIILITDQSETARAWVEQTLLQRAGRPMLIISSAQAAPMIQPYLLSGQVNGLIVGLRDGVAFESTSPDYRGPARAYWEAYNLSMLGALTIIVLGALWNGFSRRGNELDQA